MGSPPGISARVDIVTYHEYAGIVTYHKRRSIDMTLSQAERQTRRREKLKAAGKILFQAWVSQDEAVRLKAMLDGGIVTYHAPPSSPAFRTAKPAKRKRRRVDPVQEKNREIFERNIAKIRSRLTGGKKASEVAAWLNSLGFVGSGATLNGLLKTAPGF